MKSRLLRPKDKQKPLYGGVKDRYRYLTKVKPVTLIVGMYYNNGNGAMILSDSRIMRGPDFETEPKIFEIIREQIVFSAAGMSGISEQLLRKVQTEINRNGISNFWDVLAELEDLEKDIWWRYKNPMQPRFGREEVLVDGIIGGIADRKPRLYHLLENGFTEPIRTFLPVGDGSRHAHNIIKGLYESYGPSISKERAMEMGIHAIIQTSKIDTVVDDNPQVAVIENDRCQILNMNDDNEFEIYNSQLQEIKTKINGIAETQAEIFHLCLNGDEGQKNKLTELLREYESNKT